MSELVIDGLCASVGSTEILRGVDMVVRSGEVHAVMGPNGSGKSTLAHVIMGRPGYQVSAGRVTLDGVDMLDLPPHERAAAGLFLAMQYPTEVPGVSLEAMLAAALEGTGAPPDDLHRRLTHEAQRIGLEERLLGRPLNVDLSGGEKKRNETVQLAVLRPRIAVLDEIDSGLDVDALRAVSRRLQQATEDDGLGVLAITHYSRLLHELEPDRVHILAEGRIRASGGAELARELEQTGYAAYETVASTAATSSSPAEDPFADPLV